MSRIAPARPALTTALAALALAVACDHAPHDTPLALTPSASPASPDQHTHVIQATREAPPALTGRVLLDEDADRSPVDNAQILVEVLDANGDELAPITLVTDADGRFTLETIPAGAASITTHVFIDGEHATSETVAVVDGQPVKKAIVAVVLTAATLCIATTWASARKISGSDKLRHCVASCRTARWCGVGSAFTAAILKELLDSLCQYGPQWLKDLLKSTSVSACSGWDSADMAANNRGIWCASRWRTCESCCNDYY